MVARGRPRERRLDVGGGHGVVDLEGQVDVARRVDADRPVGPRVARQLGQRRQVDLEPADPLADAVGVEHRGVDLADRARRPRPPAATSDADRVGCRPGTASLTTVTARTPSSSATAPPVAHRLGRLAAAERHAEQLALVGQRAGVALAGRAGRNTWPISHSADAGVAAGGVGGQRLDQAGQQRRAQDRLLGHQRVGDARCRRRAGRSARGRRGRGTAAASPRTSPGRSAASASRRRSCWRGVRRPACGRRAARAGRCAE